MKPSWYSALVLSALCCGSVSAQEIIKSPNDHRQYQSLTLPNDLQVLLISDPKTDKAAVSMDVNVGSADEPTAVPGLAHFLEHMLFLGTKKFPRPDEYQGFVSANGGEQNAFTAFTHTNYFFDIDPGQLPQAMDRFSQFFIAPLFTPEYVDREVHAVDSEYKAKIREDGRRFYETMRRAYNPDHPISRFSVGNLTTLSNDKGQLRQELMDFYQHHYSANRMRLVVLGKRPLPELQKLVTSYFAAVPNHNIELKRDFAPLYTPQQLPARLDVKPLRELRSLTVDFPLPSLEPYRDKKPLSYIANLIGDESEGSILSVLKKQGWATSLGAGIGYQGDDASTLQLTMDLTPAGVEHVQDSLKLIFDYIDMIKEKGVEAWRYQEMAKMADLDFRYQEKFDGVSYVRSLASNLQDTPAAEVIHEHYRYDDFDPALVHQLLNKLTPENMLVSLMAPEVSTDKTTKWYKVDYSLKPIKASDYEGKLPGKLESALALPQPNPFIPEKLNLLSGNSSAHPESIYKVPGLEMWFQKDTSFNTPRSDIFINFRSPLTNDSPLHYVMSEFYVQLINQQLNAELYPALLAGIDMQLYHHLRGVSLRISGYSDKQNEILAAVQNAMLHPEFNQQRYDILRQEFSDGIDNQQQTTPYQATMRWLGERLIPAQWSSAELAKASQEMTLDKLKAFFPQWRSQMQIVALAHGNLEKDTALSMAKQLQSHWLADAKAVDVPSIKPKMLLPGTEERQSAELAHKDTAVTWYWQGADDSDKTKAEFILLSQIMSTPFYASLRTEQQLGYIVFATYTPFIDYPGLSFIVQSPKASGLQIERAIESFQQVFGPRLAQLNDQQLASFKQGIIQDLKQPDETLYQRSEYYWRELDRDAKSFDSREKMIQALENVKAADLKALFKRQTSVQDQRSLVISAVPEKS
ncbi:insulinase family protein [Pokkaliibacter sp. CJK22405]|uniref:insulinase family protein n=1 Tax=Pokkaliibacter sp. CJK22405 TaxID=3384615 RepID=UPI003984953D